MRRTSHAALWCLQRTWKSAAVTWCQLSISIKHITRRACACANTCLCMRVSPSLCVDVCLRLGEPFGPAKTSAPSYVRGLVWHLGNILYPALQHYTQFTAKGHYVPVNPLLIDISANSTTSQPHDRSSAPQKTQEITTRRVKIDP